MPPYPVYVLEDLVLLGLEVLKDPESIFEFEEFGLVFSFLLLKDPEFILLELLLLLLLGLEEDLFENEPELTLPELRLLVEDEDLLEDDLLDPDLGLA